MEISLKVQNIGAAYNPEAKETIVITHEFTTPSDQLLKKRGRLFISLKIGANGKFDLKEASSLFLDSVQENFYRLTEETPLHSLEKALNRAIKLVLTIKSKDETISLGSIDADFKLSFATALIWNKVLYTSYLGTPAVYLVRGTGVRNLSMNPAANEIWTNSGILDNQDVIIIGTESFAKTFPSNEIINSLGNISQAISAHPQKDELAAMLIKVSTNEDTSSQISDKSAREKLKETIGTAIWKVKSKFGENEKLSDRFKFYQNKKTAPVSSISGVSASPSQQASGTLQKGPKRLSSTRHKKTKKTVSIGLAMVTVALIGFYQFFLKPLGSIADDEILASISPSELGGARVMGSAASNTKPNSTLTTELHTKTLDVQILAENPTVVGLSSTSKAMLILEAGQKALFRVNPSTKDFEKIFEDSSMPQFLKCETTLCYVADSSVFYVLNPETPDKADPYPHNITGLTDIYPYQGILYLLTDKQIYTQKIGVRENTSIEEWLKGEATLNGAKSMAIDGNVYVLTNTEVIKYYQGNKVVAFNLDFSDLQNPSQIVVHSTKLYVLDNKHLHVFNKTTGAFLETIELTTDNTNPKLFTISQTPPSKILFEKSKVIYEVEL